MIQMFCSLVPFTVALSICRDHSVYDLCTADGDVTETKHHGEGIGHVHKDRDWLRKGN